jgi:hypothetical protein
MIPLVITATSATTADATLPMSPKLATAIGLSMIAAQFTS